MKLLDVPYRSQWDADASDHITDCGPTCLAMVLNYAGIAISTDKVYEQLIGERKPKAYTTLGELRKAAKQKDVQIDLSLYQSDTALDSLKEQIDAGYPLIALVKYAPWRAYTGHTFEWGHFVVVVGYDADNIYFHDPLFGLWQTRSKGDQLAMPTDLFMAGWGGFEPTENPNWLCGVVVVTADTSTTIVPDEQAAEETTDTLEQRIMGLAAYRFAHAPDLTDEATRQLWAAHLGDWGETYSEYVVQAGDTLGQIAYEHFGYGSLWPAITAYNGRTGSTIIVAETLRLPHIGESGATTTDALPRNETNHRGGDGFDIIPGGAVDYDALGAMMSGVGYENDIDDGEVRRSVAALSAVNHGFHSDPPANKPMAAGTSIMVQWVFLNDGTEAWTPDFRFSLVETTTSLTEQLTSDPFGEKVSYRLEELGVIGVVPGDFVALTLTLTVPREAGVHSTRWQLHDPGGRPFGSIRWMIVRATEPAVPLDEPIESGATPLPSLAADAVGMTMSHYEFDMHQLERDGTIADFQLKGAIDQSYRDMLGRFDVLRFMNWQKINVVTWKKPEFDETFHSFAKPPGNVAMFRERESRADLMVSDPAHWRKLFAPRHAPIGFGGDHLSDEASAEMDEQKGRTDGHSSDSPWYYSDGVPLSICLKVALQTTTNPWICIPHGDSLSDFTELMEEITRITFEALEGSGLKPIFEFSNEIWNTKFEQHDDCKARTLDPENREEFAGVRDDYRAHAWQIERTNQIKAHVGDRAYVVLGAWANKPDRAQALLNDPEGVMGGHRLSDEVDALAIAPYFGNPRDGRHLQSAEFDHVDLEHGYHPLIMLGTGQQIDVNGDLDTALDLLHQNMIDYIKRETLPNFIKHREAVDKYNTQRPSDKARLRLWTYEGGLDVGLMPKIDLEVDNEAKLPIFSRDRNRWKTAEWLNRINGRTGDEIKDPILREPLIALYNAYHRSEKAGELVAEVLKGWRSAAVGGELFCAYSSSTKYGGEWNKNPDYFGYIDLVEKHYRATHKLSRLLDSKQSD